MCVWIISRLTADPTLTILVRPVFQCSTTFEMEIESWHSFWNIWRLLLKYVPYILAKYDDTLWKSNQVNLFQIHYLWDLFSMFTWSLHKDKELAYFFPTRLMGNVCLNNFKANGQSYFGHSCETSFLTFSNFWDMNWNFITRIIPFKGLYI